VTTWQVIHGDCLEVLKTLPAGSVDAVVTDPPYGIGEARNNNASRGKLAVSKDYGCSAWDDERPPRIAFDEVRRVSREQVIWGGNYFADMLPPSPSWISWDKDNGNTDFADVELAWTSHKRAARKVRWRWHGMLQEHGGRRKEQRYYPTQKPVGLMVWVLENYTDPSATILDPFMGSSTTGVACMKTGRNFIGIEIDKGYCEIARRRISEAANHLFAGADA
jgi:site-specific DNA-methyltransferase (adenine-specific)